jgi:CRP-like cAMP-binding protein
MSVALSPVEKALSLQRVDIFKHATAEMLNYLSAIADVVEIPRHVVIFSEQEVSDAMYIVVSGRVRLERDGVGIVIAEAGESVGSWALFDNAPRLMTAIALEHTVLLRIRSDAFSKLLEDHEEVTPAIFTAVMERVKSLAPDAP